MRARRSSATVRITRGQCGHGCSGHSSKHGCACNVPTSRPAARRARAFSRRSTRIWIARASITFRKSRTATHHTRRAAHRFRRGRWGSGCVWGFCWAKVPMPTSPTRTPQTALRCDSHRHTRDEDAAMPPLRAGNLLATVEGIRLHSSECARWQRWGPYLSERQWGTVREDYSPNGTAWDYFPHDHARSRAYRWGEDGIAGFGDDTLNWCGSIAMWNRADPILKERLFGLTNQEGNHGEDVKELYFYLDGTPTHSYMRMLYKYPHGAFPYQDLVEENRRRGADLPEYEVLDTGIFDDSRYFDVTVEYAKNLPEDIVMRVTVENRADESASLDLLPQIWARNKWSWKEAGERPKLTKETVHGVTRLLGTHPGHEPIIVTAWSPDTTVLEWLFCENDTNVRRHFNMDAPGPFKDGFNDYLVHG